jgi:hypothetical protein
MFHLKNDHSQRECYVLLAQKRDGIAQTADTLPMKTYTVPVENAIGGGINSLGQLQKIRKASAINCGADLWLLDGPIYGILEATVGEADPPKAQS